jgi:hypothetical protein
LLGRVAMRKMNQVTVGTAGFGSIAEVAPMSDVDKKNVEVVMGWSAAWKTGDAEKVASFMHEKIAFRGDAQKMDVPPVVGKENAITCIANILSVTTIDMQVLDTFALAPIVVTCHHQLFETKEHGPLEGACGAAEEGFEGQLFGSKERRLLEDLYIGCFYLEDGKIREWNDYAINPFAQPRQNDTASKGKFFHG